MDLGTRLTIFLRGRLVGNDAFGNRYYLEKSQRRGHLRARRWVVYAGEKDASAVPAEWHGWLHHTIDTALPETGRRPGQKRHLPNATGTPLAYRPPGHDYRGCVIEAPRMATMSPGRQVVSGAVPRSWRRCSRHALVRPIA